MFIQFFGNYLLNNNFINQTQLTSILEDQKNSRVKLGLIAVAEKLLTEEQAAGVYLLQSQLDKRFGDIAVEKGYLTSGQLNNLLKLQGNPYLLFVQSMTERKYMTMEEINNILNKYQKENEFTDMQMNAFKSGDLDQLISLFISETNPLYTDYAGLVLRNILRFISSNFYFGKVSKLSSYSFDNLAAQSLVGDHELFLAFAGKGNSILKIANPYAKEEFDSVNEDAFDSVCEFINCINGLFSRKLGETDIEVDMLPPVFYTEKTLISDDIIYVLPVYIGNDAVDMLISIDTNFTIK